MNTSLSRIKPLLSPLQCPTGGGDVRAILLGCPQTFFLKGQLQMMQKTERSTTFPTVIFFLRQSIFEFGQRDVRLLRYQLPHQILVRRQREIFVAAEFGRVDAARLPVKLEEADDRADADPALLRGFRDRGPAPRSSRPHAYANPPNMASPFMPASSQQEA